MGRRNNSWAKKMKQFVALLKRNDHEDSPQTKLLDEAGRLCKNLQHSSRSLEKLVKTMEQGRHWGFFLTNIHIVRASVLVHIRSCQYDVACKLLENCRAIEKEELVQLWNEIHYHKAMEKWHKKSLTPVQKFRCRKRNPPPVSLCPEGVKNRNYPTEVRQMLQRFAMEMTIKPSREQREVLAQATNLPPQHIYNWFANYRRRQKTRPCQPEEPIQSSGVEETTCQERVQTERTEGQTGPTQNADGLHEGAGLEQMETLLVASDPGLQQGIRGLGYPGSISQKSQLEGFGSSPECLSPIHAKEFTAFCSQAEEEHGGSLGTTKGEPQWDSDSTAASLWMQNTNHVSCDLHPMQQWAETLPVCRTVSEATSKADQYTLWSLDAPGAISACGRMSPSVCIEARVESVREQAENEGPVLRERQLGSLEAPLPHSSTSRCPGVSVPGPEERQILVHEQMWWDPSNIDTLWAAWMLCEFSCGNRL